MDAFEASGPYAEYLVDGVSQFVVRPRAPYLAPMAGIGAVGALVATFALDPSSRALMRASVFVTLALGAWAVQPLLDRGRILRVEFDGTGDVVLVSGQEALRLTRGEIGGVGYAGSSIVGRLSPPFGRFDPPRDGRVVVVDGSAHVLAALRSGWMPIEVLEEGTGFGGHRWIGRFHLDAITLAPPSSQQQSSRPSVPPSEEAVSDALLRMRSQARELLRWWTAILGVVWLSVVVLSRADAPDAVVDPLRLVFGLGIAGWVAVLLTQPLRSSPVRQVRKIASDAAWEAVDVVVLRGAPSDMGVRSVVCLDPSGWPIDSWLVEPSVTSRWIQEYQRRTCFLARAADDKHAVLASADGANLSLVVRRTGMGKSPEIHAWAKLQLTERWRALPRRS